MSLDMRPCHTAETRAAKKCVMLRGASAPSLQLLLRIVDSRLRTLMHANQLVPRPVPPIQHLPVLPLVGCGQILKRAALVVNLLHTAGGGSQGPCLLLDGAGEACDPPLGFLRALPGGGGGKRVQEGDAANQAKRCAGPAQQSSCTRMHVLMSEGQSLTASLLW